MASAPLTASDKLLRTLLAFERGQEQSLASLAKHTELPKSTVHRLLTSLKEYNFVEQDTQSGLYRLGLRAWSLSLHARPYEAIRREARPYLEHLAIETSETVFLTLVDGMHSVCIDCVEGLHSLRVSMKVGFTFPLHLGASNRILMAFMPHAQRQEALAYWCPDSAQRDMLAGELIDVRRAGFVFTTAQLTPGVSALAVPVLDSEGRIIVGLSIGGPQDRFVVTKAETQLQLLQEVASDMATNIYHRSFAEIYAQ